MISLIWAVISWALVFLLIPVQRIKDLFLFSLVSTAVLFGVDLTFVTLGYYIFPDGFSVLGIPFFYLVGGMAGSILFINWLPQNPFYKIISVLAFSLLFKITEEVFIYYGAYRYLNFSRPLSYTLNVAGFSILVWLGLGIVGEEKLYFGNKNKIRI